MHTKNLETRGKRTTAYVPDDALGPARKRCTRPGALPGGHEPESPGTPTHQVTSPSAWTPLSPAGKQALRDKSPQWTVINDLTAAMHASQFEVYQLLHDGKTYVVKEMRSVLLQAEVEAWNEGITQHCNVARWEFLHCYNVAAMPCIDGASMLQFLEHHSVVADDTLRSVVRQVLAGLQHMHVQAETAHGDLSLGNVLITERGHVVIIDVDNAVRAFYSRSQGVRPELPGCTCSPSIMSPETARVYSEGMQVDIPADVWAVGMLVLFMLHGLRVRVGPPTDITPTGLTPLSAGISYLFFLGRLLADGTTLCVMRPTRVAPPWAAAVLAGALQTAPAHRMHTTGLLDTLETMDSLAV